MCCAKHQQQKNRNGDMENGLRVDGNAEKHIRPREKKRTNMQNEKLVKRCMAASNEQKTMRRWVASR